MDQVKKCARCGGIHLNVKIMPLTGQGIKTREGYTLTHFFNCPETNNPVLIHVELKENKG